MFAFHVPPPVLALVSIADAPPASLLAWAASIAALSLLWAVTKPRKPSYRQPRAPHRSSTALPLLGDTIDAVRLGPSAFLTWKMRDECARVGGEPVLVRVLGQPDMLVVATPSAVEDVLKTHFDAFERRVYDTFLELTGDGLFGVDGDKWALQRRAFSKLFTPHALRGSDGVMPVIYRHATSVHRLLQQHLASDKADAPVNLSALFSDFTMEVMTELGFGVTMGYIGAAHLSSGSSSSKRDDAQAFVQAIEGVQAVMARRFALPKWLWRLQRALGVGMERELHRHLARVDDVTMQLIDRSLAQNQGDSSAAKRRTLVSVFMEDLQADAGRISSSGELKLLRDVAIGFLVAGRDSTVQTLSWLFYCVHRHPSVQQRLTKELGLLRSSTNSDADVFLPTADQLQQLTYMEAALRETMRLYPVVGFNMRTCVADTTLSDGIFVRSGTRVGLPTFAMGRIENLWGEDADEFKPERWLEEDGRVRQVSAFRFPVFHAGPRVCLGMHLSMLELKTMAAVLLSSFQLVVTPDDHEAKYIASLTQPMETPLMVRVASSVEAFAA